MFSLAIIFFTLLVTSGETSAACTELFSEVGTRCLRFLPDVELDWTDAQSRCDVIGGHLARVDDCSLIAGIAAYVGAHGVQPTSGAYWIGATDRLQEGKFIWISNNQTELSLGTPFWGTSENIREPNGGSLQNCVAMMKNQAYHFHDVECSVKLGALCEQKTDAETDTATGEPHCTTGVATGDVTATTKEPYTLTEATTSTEGTSSSALETTGNTGKTDTTTVEHYSTTEKPAVLCPTGYTSISGRCFLFLTDAVESWTAARLTCSLNNSGRLAYVDNCHILGDLAAYIRDNDISPTTGYWIGIHDHEAEGIFRFTNGTLAPLTTPLWGFTNDTMEPNGGLSENCVAMIAADDFFLHDDDCDAALAVLCEAAWNTDTQFYM